MIPAGSIINIYSESTVVYMVAASTDISLASKLQHLFTLYRDYKLVSLPFQHFFGRILSLAIIYTL